MTATGSCPICGAINGACNSWQHDDQIGVTRGVVFHQEKDDEMERFNRVEDRRLYRSHGRFFVDAERERVVPEESPEAAFLLTTPNSSMPLADAVRYGLADEDGNPLDPFTGKKEKVEQQEEVDDKRVRGPNEAPKKKIEKLTEISGLGKSTEEALAEKGIASVEDLMATETNEIVALEIAGLTPGKVDDFKRQVEAANAPQDDEDGSGEPEDDEDEDD